MRDGVSITKSPRELRAEKRSRNKEELVSPTSKNKRAKTKDKNLDNKNLATNLANNKNKWSVTKDKNLESQNLAVNLANKNKKSWITFKHLNHPNYAKLKLEWAVNQK